MKILEVCLFSAGIDGVFARVKQESLLLAKKGHEVRIFSSNKVKGDNSIAQENDKIGNVIIKRFSVKKIPFAESFMVWDDKRLINAIKEYHPDVIIAHSYRHIHTFIASKIAHEIGAKCFLVTHAPFGDDDRSLPAKIYVKLFDKFAGKGKIKHFNKIITITRWEMPYLLKLNVNKEKIEYIPNGIDDEFFTIRKGKEENKILFLGRISPIKDIETLIMAFALINDKRISLEIVGMAEKNYLIKLKKLVKKLNIWGRVVFSPPVFEIKEKINKIDSSKIFVLPSRREGMPQSLIEAMSRKKIVIGSDNIGNKELIKDSKNGYLFKIGNAKELAEKIDFALAKNNKLIGKNAKKSVEQFKWSKVIDKLNKVIMQS